jgi:phage anti-repressor protein
MRPSLWQPPIELSQAEAKIIKRIKRAKLFTFLRQIRHELFDESFQHELNEIFADSAYGHPPIAPAQVALAIIIQAYTQASDDEAIESLEMDRRWQLVLDCLDCERPPFSKATLVRVRRQLIRHRLERRLVERTISLAKQTGGFGASALRGALDSSPLWGAGRVEDTYNLLGHALGKALSVCATQQGWELSQVHEEAGAELLNSSSLKAALDINWEDQTQSAQGLHEVLEMLESVQQWFKHRLETQQSPEALAHLATAQQIKQQNIEVNDQGKAVLRQGVAPNRRISISDPHMRHGRKSRRQRIDGYKQHILKDLDSQLIRCVGVTPANVPEAWITDALDSDLKAQGVILKELHIDRAYLNSKWVKNRSPDLAIYCKAWPVHSRKGRFSKAAFTMNWDNQTLQCPNQVTLPFSMGKTLRFPAHICQQCPLKDKCTTSSKGRSVSIHRDEKFLQELRQRQLTPQGRAKLRQRVSVEHSLAHLSHWQGQQARYRTLRKNLFDARRHAVVHNLHVLMRILEPETQKTQGR